MADWALTRRLLVGASVAFVLAPADGAARTRRSQNGAEDMAPTVLPNEIVQLQHFDAAQAHVGDIIVYLHRRFSGEDAEPYMKRIMALPGQRIAFRQGVPILDGLTATSEYVSTEDLRYESDGSVVHPGIKRHRETLADRTYDTYHDSGWENGRTIRQCHIFGRERICRSQDIRNTEEILVPEHHLYVAGDNRDSSEDSRWHGPIAIAAVRRRAVSIVSSPVRERIGLGL